MKGSGDCGPQPTTLLWISEGFTDYYADLGVVRAGVIDSGLSSAGGPNFLTNTLQHIQTVAQAPAVSVEDASLSIWIHPTDGTDYLYYDKGAVIALLLDILIRDASNNRGSLDQVMRGLYQATVPRGLGFTNEQFWAAVSRAAGGRSFADFNRRFVDGRDALPYDSVLPLAGLRLVAEVTQVPRMGVQTQSDSLGRSVVVALVPGGAFAAAGVEVGDTVVSVAGLDQRRDTSGDEFRTRMAGREGQSYPIVVRRGGQERTLTGVVRMGAQTVTRLDYDRSAGEKAARMRTGILTGR